jgi:uncharacterized membrane protein YraQ (UPF0718 family)
MREASSLETSIAFTFLTAPIVAVIAALAIAGALDWPTALLAIFAASLLVALILRWHLRRVAILRQAIDALRGDIAAPLPPAQPTPLSPGLDTAVAEMARERRRQRHDLQETVAGGRFLRHRFLHLHDLRRPWRDVHGHRLAGGAAGQ